MTRFSYNLVDAARKRGRQHKPGGSLLDHKDVLVTFTAIVGVPANDWYEEDLVYNFGTELTRWRGRQREHKDVVATFVGSL